MEVPLWQVIVLAVVQGITEFLPISSDGHLVVLASLLAEDTGPANLDIPDLVVVLHGGTLLSILVFYWRRIWELLWSDRHVLLRIVVATLPAVCVGLPVKLFFEHWLGSPILAGVCLIITGIVLIVARWPGANELHYRQLPMIDAVWIGLAQAAAILPGLSRSGCTITTGLRVGMTPVSAATFSFLMAIPAIAGACLLEAVSLWKGRGMSIPAGHLLIGTVVSFGVGLASLSLLVRWLQQGRFALFAWWCIPLGIAVLVWQLWQ